MIRPLFLLSLMLAPSGAVGQTIYPSTTTCDGGPCYSLPQTVGCFDKYGNEISGPCPAGEDRSWHLLTKSYGGTVSLIKDLTETECEHMKKRLAPPSCDNCIYQVTPSMIEMSECFR